MEAAPARRLFYLYVVVVAAAASRFDSDSDSDSDSVCCDTDINSFVILFSTNFLLVEVDKQAGRTELNSKF
jgi:hypothetical protein